MLNKNLLPVSIIIAGMIIGGVLFYSRQACPSLGKVEKLLTSQEAVQKAIDFINKNMMSEGQTASLVSAQEESGLYQFKIKIGEQEFKSYVTRDGKILFPNAGIDLDSSPSTAQEPEVQEEITKRDTPDVKVFVMSYCPFGLQAMKMFLPVYDLLQDKAEMELYFVDYIMHEKQEIDENLRIYCVQKEQEEKFYNYLNCFVKDGDFEKCLGEAKIDKTKLNNCVAETDKEYKVTEQYNDKSTWLNGNFPKFDIHTDLNKKYGVRGSPTVVLNDIVVNISPRSPENFKKTICQAFVSEPEECSRVLSEENPSPGFGRGTSESRGGACK